MPKPGPRTTYQYSDAFKATAVRLSQLPGVAVRDVAESLYIHPFMLSRWRKLAREGRIVTKGIDVDPAVAAELKALRLHGMAATWADLIEQNKGELDGSRWLIEQMLRAEATDRATRSVSHQMNAAKFPVHRDLAGFDFECSPVGRKLIEQLAGMAFT